MLNNNLNHDDNVYGCSPGTRRRRESGLQVNLVTVTGKRRARSAEGSEVTGRGIRSSPGGGAVKHNSRVRRNQYCILLISMQGVTPSLSQPLSIVPLTRLRNPITSPQPACTLNCKHRYWKREYSKGLEKPFGLVQRLDRVLSIPV
ncbi:hypothetical protein M0802_011829 [Mischocyttarus mexicanus]|nr:hypothetical protein M0802_011839 [Mischocyttarus mexicanus]KAI4487790.1 hypothetical protein M0802_011829 [Mischocyttarus mexicanus]